MYWLTDELKENIRNVFEPKYNKGLLDSEVLEVANNLVSYMENVSKFKWRLKNAESRI